MHQNQKSSNNCWFQTIVYQEFRGRNNCCFLDALNALNVHQVDCCMNSKICRFVRIITRISLFHFVCLFVFPLCSQACPIVSWNCSWKCSIFPTPHDCNTFLFISSLTVGVKPRYPHFLGSVKLNLH